MGKYKPVRMPIEAYENWKKRKKEMEETIFRITGKHESIPLTNLLLETSKRPLFDINELMALSKRKWKAI